MDEEDGDCIDLQTLESDCTGCVQTVRRDGMGIRRPWIRFNQAVIIGSLKKILRCSFGNRTWGRGAEVTNANWACAARLETFCGMRQTYNHMHLAQSHGKIVGSKAKYDINVLTEALCLSLGCRFHFLRRDTMTRTVHHLLSYPSVRPSVP